MTWRSLILGLAVAVAIPAISDALDTSNNVAKAKPPKADPILSIGIDDDEGLAALKKDLGFTGEYVPMPVIPPVPPE